MNFQNQIEHYGGHGGRHGGRHGRGGYGGYRGGYGWGWGAGLGSYYYPQYVVEPTIVKEPSPDKDLIKFSIKTVLGEDPE